MSRSTTNYVLTRVGVVAILALVVAAAPAVAQEPPRALCFLESFEAEMEEDSAINHSIEMEVYCAHADRAVLDVAEFDLQLLDGDADLIEAGVAWMKAYEEAGGRGFFSTQDQNIIEVSEKGRKRWVELRAHSHAIPKTGVARLEGAVDLVVEADCVGQGAIEAVTVQTTAGALRSGAAIPLADGGEITATEQGQHNDSPMLVIGGAGSYVSLVEPPEGVAEKIFFGSKRVVIELGVAGDVAVTLEICPSEVVTVPVMVEAQV